MSNTLEELDIVLVTISHGDDDYSFILHGNNIPLEEIEVTLEYQWCILTGGAQSLPKDHTLLVER